jgi:hypothetical protein
VDEVAEPLDAETRRLLAHHEAHGVHEVRFTCGRGMRNVKSETNSLLTNRRSPLELRVSYRLRRRTRKISMNQTGRKSATVQSNLCSSRQGET